MCIMVPEIVVPELRVNDPVTGAITARDAQSSLDVCLTRSNYFSFLRLVC